MTSFGFEEMPHRPLVVDDGEVHITTVTGANDPAATPMGREILRFVEAKTGGARMLRRQDFTPADFRKYLSNIMLLDVAFDDDGVPADGIIRLMGSSLAAYYGEYTGKSVLAHPSKSGSRMIRAMQMMAETGKCVVIYTAQLEADREFYKIISLIVPIEDAAGNMVQTLAHIQPYKRNGEPVVGP